MTFDPAAQGWTSWQSMGFTEMAGPFWSKREGDGWAYGFLVEERHLNRGYIVHGGMLATFADIALGRTAYDKVKPRSCATIQLNMHYVSAALPGEFVQARGEIIKVTNTLVFTRGQLTASDKVIAMADGVWKILAEGRRLNPARQKDAKD